METISTDLRKKVQLKRNFDILKNSPGWSDLETYLKARECKLLRLILTGKVESITSYRDKLKEIQDLKKFLEVTLSDGEDAVKELARYEEKFGQMI